MVVKKIVTIGGAMQDQFVRYKNQPESISLQRPDGRQDFIILPEGHKIEVNSINKSVGGGATNAAVSCRRLGLSVTTIYKVGKDDAGNTITDTLSKMDINTDYVLYTDDTPTGTSIILPTPSGDRTCLIYRGANTTLSEQEFPLSVIDSHPYVYITSLNGHAASLLPIITLYAHAQGHLVAVNPGIEQLTNQIESLIQSLPYIDILILNMFEAGLLMQKLGTIQPLNNDTTTRKIPPIIQEYGKKIITHGPKIAVVTDGKKGVYAIDAKKIYFHPSLSIAVTSTLGAGDACGSTFFAQYAQGDTIANALRAGVVNSASVLQYENTQKGLLLLQELQVELKKTLPALEVFDW